jgi:hypothetical protein
MWHIGVWEVEGRRYQREIVEGDKWEYEDNKKCDLLLNFQAKF